MSIPSRFVFRALLATAAVLPFAAGAPQPVRAATTPWTAVTVSTAAGSGALPVLASRPWNAVQPDVGRAVILLHGRARDAAQYDVIGRQAQEDAGAAGRDAMLVTPLFAAPGDATLPPAAGTVPPELVWPGTGWMEGGAADGPAPLTAFDALDALIAHFSDRARYPALREIVLVGHSGGGQLVQRFAELRGDPPPGAPPLRFVVANPSSYGYFTPDRPVGDDRFAPFPGAAQCPGFDDWKYGMRNLPAAAGGLSARQIEDRYASRNVTYLLGALDNDPALEALDRSCAAEAQGPTHLIRGQDFFRYLQGRHPSGLDQRLVVIPRAEHDAAAMFTAPCALAAIFDAPSCGNVPSVPPTLAPAVAAGTAGAVLKQRPKAPPRRVEHRPHLARGTVWQPGYWDWNGSDYVWIPGSVRPASFHRSVLVPGHWQWSWNRFGWFWIPPHYR
ncbi:MAG: YXWGXW repeat-containing protein [Gluconacetobacter diazotrophicus]|nr:YXWGXW repeat-containing protein [Gluconacetobacter diazotrophicus]